MQGGIGVGFLLAMLATAGNNVGKGLQKLGVAGLSGSVGRARLLRTCLANRVFAFGLAVDVLGGLLTVPALALAPVSVVQPVLSAGMALLIIFSHRILKERMARWEWIGVMLSVLGSAGVGASLGPGGGSPDLVGGIVLLVTVGLLLGALELVQRGRRPSELAAGAQAGVCFGSSAAVVRGGMLASRWPVHLSPAVAGLCAGATLTGAGFLLQTRGLLRGRAMVVGSWAGALALATAVTAGMVVLGEPLPASSSGRLLRLASLIVIATGVPMMAGARRRAKGC